MTVTYKGTLATAFCKESVAVEGLPNRYMIYRGTDCAPFSAYMRFRGSSAIIANISGLGPRSKMEQQGRMPLILNALERYFDMVAVEQVQNPYLDAFMRKRPGYIVNGNTFVWGKAHGN